MIASIFHQKARRWMTRYFNGDLSVKRAEWLRAHVTACPECRSIFLLLSQSEATLPDSSTRRHERMEAALFGGPARPSPIMQDTIGSFRWMRVAMGGALSVAMILLFFIPLHFKPHENDFREKGSAAANLSQGIDIHVYHRLQNQGLFPTKDRIVADQPLAFAYSHLGDHSLKYLLLFGVDELGNIY